MVTTSLCYPTLPGEPYNSIEPWILCWMLWEKRTSSTDGASPLPSTSLKERKQPPSGNWGTSQTCCSRLAYKYYTSRLAKIPHSPRPSLVWRVGRWKRKLNSPCSAQSSSPCTSVTWSVICPLSLLTFELPKKLHAGCVSAKFFVNLLAGFQSVKRVFDSGSPWYTWLNFCPSSTIVYSLLLPPTGTPVSLLFVVWNFITVSFIFIPHRLAMLWPTFTAGTYSNVIFCLWSCQVLAKDWWRVGGWGLLSPLFCLAHRLLPPPHLQTAIVVVFVLYIQYSLVFKYCSLCPIFVLSPSCVLSLLLFPSSTYPPLLNVSLWLTLEFAHSMLEASPMLETTPNPIF